MTFGKHIVVLNGPTSSGKTKLISEIRRSCKDLVFQGNIDILWNVFNDNSRTIFRNRSNALPHGFFLKKTEKGLEHDIDEPCLNLMKEYIKFVSNVGRSTGFIMDEVIAGSADLRKKHLSLYLEHMETPAFFIGTFCQEDILRQRALKRASDSNMNERRPGDLLAPQLDMHKDMIYDCVLDSSYNSTVTLAEQLYDYINNNKPVALDMMRKQHMDKVAYKYI